MTTADWNATTVWETSTTCAAGTWTFSAAAPTSSAAGIVIRNGATITMRATAAGITNYTGATMNINAGGALVQEVLSATQYANLTSQ